MPLRLAAAHLICGMPTMQAAVITSHNEQPLGNRVRNYKFYLIYKSEMQGVSLAWAFKNMLQFSVKHNVI